MKSKLFSSIMPTGQFIEDFSIILKLSPNALKQFEGKYNERIAQPQRLEESILMKPDEAQEFATKLSISTEELKSLFEVTDFVTQNTFKENDDINTVLDDLITLELIPSDAKDSLTNLFNNIYPKGVEIAKQRRRAAYEHGELFTLTDLAYDIDLRLIPTEAYNPLITKIEDYMPKGAELVPIAIINLETSSNDKTENCLFQVNFAELEDLIVRLQACQKELRLIETLSQKLDISKI